MTAEKPIASGPRYLAVAVLVALWLGLGVALNLSLAAHVSAGENSRWGEFRAVVFVSVLWAVWHLPMQARGETTPVQQLGLVLHICGIAIAGVSLAYAWRRSGTLALPAAMHALGNARVLNG